MPFRTLYIEVPASHVIKLNWLITLRGGRWACTRLARRNPFKMSEHLVLIFGFSNSVKHFM